MSDFTFRPAVREQVGLIIGLIGPSGSGKTMSAMRLAEGIVGKDKPFAVIDTEARRALHYADMFRFDHLELEEPFRPSLYAEAIQAADKAGYGAIVVDSTSHEWSGVGGVIEWQEEELQRMAGDDWKKRESCKMAAWIKPKTSHKAMIQRMLQVRSVLILCFRAEERIKMEKDPKTNKTIIVPIGWQPVCSKELPYELTVSFLLTPEKPGFPSPIKLQEQHKALFPLDKPINQESGRLVSEWAKGGKVTEEIQKQEPAADTFLDQAKKQCDEAKTKEELKAWAESHKKEQQTSPHRKNVSKLYVDAASHFAPGTCPEGGPMDGKTPRVEFCGKCSQRDGCPTWPVRE